MNMYIIIGIGVVALGTYLIYVGASKSNKTIQNEITDKIVETQQKIEELKSNPNSDKNKIGKIENEFLSWADEFIKNKEKKKIELEKTSISKKEQRADLELIWKPQFNSFFEHAKELIDAYNLKSGDTIEYKIPPLPDNLFGFDTVPYIASIKFRKDIIWKISITPAKILASDVMASFDLYIFENDNFEGNDITDSIVFKIYENKIQLVKLDNQRFNFNQIPITYPYEEDVFQKISHDLIENQLIQL